MRAAACDRHTRFLVPLRSSEPSHRTHPEGVAQRIARQPFINRLKFAPSVASIYQTLMMLFFSTPQ